MAAYVVTLRGTKVFHECSLIGTISGIGGDTLAKVADYIHEKYNLDVYDFTKQPYSMNLCAWTDNKDVKVFIEHVYTLF